MKHNFTLHVFHDAEIRMIERGMDGDSMEGGSKGLDTRCFVPIHLSPIQSSPGLLKWVKS